MRKLVPFATILCVVFMAGCPGKDDDDDKDKEIKSYTGTLAKSEAGKWQLVVGSKTYQLNVNTAAELPDLEATIGKTVVVQGEPRPDNRIRVKTLKVKEPPVVTDGRK